MLSKWLKTLLEAGKSVTPVVEECSETFGRPRFDRVAAGEGFYVYVHLDPSGAVFYVGKGTGRRAWLYGRDPLWNLYVSQTLRDQYQVQIIASGLTEEDAIDREDDLMRKYGDQLINRQNMGRTMDFDALSRRDALFSRMHELVASSKMAGDPLRRLALLQEALSLHYEATVIRFEGGLVGDVMASQPGYGNVDLITLVVDAYLDSVRPMEAKSALDHYLEFHPQHLTHKVVQSLQRAVEKGKPRRKHAVVEFVPPPELPPDWERGEEGGTAVIRLRRPRSAVAGSLDQKLQRIYDLVQGGKEVEALDRLKDYIVADEARNPSGIDLWEWPHHRAIKLALKLKRPLEECLFLQRLIHHYRDRPVLQADLQLRLRRRAAVVKR